MKTLPVLVPPWAAGASPTNNIFPFVSPKPVIGFDVPALCDIVESGKDGILVKPFIKNELLNATIEMLSDNQKIERYGRSGKIKQKEIYGLNKMVNSTIHALSILINKDAQKNIKTN